MSHCREHDCAKPCYYCKQGFSRFKNIDEHIHAQDRRMAAIEKALLGQQQVAQEPSDGFKVREAIGVIRDYALGDLVMLSPSLKRLKEKNPGRPLALVTIPGLFDVLEGADYLEALLPKSGYQDAHFHKVYDLCGAAEVEAGGKLKKEIYLSTPRPDVFARLLEVDGGAEKFPIPVNPQALAKVRGVLCGCKPPFIGLAATCGSPYRSLPPDYVAPLAEALAQKYGGTVLLLGKTREYVKHLADLRLPRIINLINSLSVAELIAAISLLDALVSPDTGTMHIAGALEIPCLCLMANNDPKIYSDFYQTVNVVQATELPCVPCHDISIPCVPLPRGQVGAACMQALTPERVMAEFGKFFNGKRIAYLHDTPLSFVGGAEITTKGMVKAGRERGYHIRLLDKDSPIEQFHTLYRYDLIILSNIWRFTPGQMAIIQQAIKTVPYVKYEHDHDGINGVTATYPSRKLAKAIYGNSDRNIFVSPAQQADYEKAGMSNGNGIAIPELVDTEMFRPVKGVKRRPQSYLIAVPGKWAPGAVGTFCKNSSGKEQVKVLEKPLPHDQMPALFSEFEIFAHDPARTWPCDRVIFEAALCGCKVAAGPLVEAMSWERDLTDQEGLRAWLAEVPDKFWGEIGGLLQ